MRGVGIKLGITTNNQTQTRLLDLTRLVSRAGRVLTGVDRVEFAYLRALLAINSPLYGLIRTHYGYAILDRAGCSGIMARIGGTVDWGPVDRLSRVARGLDDARRIAESDVRRLAIARCLPMRLGKTLRKYLPTNTSYINVGHSNLSDRTLSAISQDLGAKITVMIHDTIPIDFPQYQRDGTVDRFVGLLRRVGVWADQVICNSAQTQNDILRHLAPARRMPSLFVAHLGIDPSPPSPVQWPATFAPTRPMFCTIGTIEPRKNHALLLDLWDAMAKDIAPDQMPQLLICGSRGWENKEVFDRLDQNPLVGQSIFEIAGLTDGQITTVLDEAKALLFPSFAEGYGLPPVEAAAIGCPILCNDLPIYREILGDIPVYADVCDLYSWLHHIAHLADPKSIRSERAALSYPSWENHFNTVLTRA